MRLGLAAALAAAVALGAPATAVAQADHPRDEPVVLDGASLARLAGVAPERVVAFRYKRTRSGKHEKWRQIPVQVDERKLVDFGSAPGSNNTPGVDGTVYGTAPIGVTALQYTDPATFVGADSDPALDADDEVTLMAGDAGDKARKRSRRPRGVRKATRLRVADPLGAATRFVYLFESTGNRSSAAGRDYVDYDFVLDSGDYKQTYKRADGPNPEHSTVATPVYSAALSDRWFFDGLSIAANGASGAEILDGFKFQFAPNTCGRSEATFNDAEGAFVANIDGPVRAIRSYVGANSGPLTERTQVFYRDRYEIVTDLRVHPVGGLMTFHDLSTAGIGMTYLDSVNRGGVPVDGNQDAVDSALPSWRLWTGAQGSLWSADRIESSFKDAMLAASSAWYLDDSTPGSTQQQCWGDSQALGEAGIRSTYSLPDTDPRTGGTDFLHTQTTDVVSGPGGDAAGSDRLASELDAPLAPTAKPVRLRSRD